jgi:hypothetical protein
MFISDTSMRMKHYLTDPESKKFEEMRANVVKPSISSPLDDAEQQETLTLIRGSVALDNKQQMF